MVHRAGRWVGAGGARRKAALWPPFVTWAFTQALTPALSRERERGKGGYASRGLGLSVSIPYSLIARATSFGVILPSAASATIAAWATW